MFCAALLIILLCLPGPRWKMGSFWFLEVVGRQIKKNVYHVDVGGSISLAEKL